MTADADGRVVLDAEPVHQLDIIQELLVDILHLDPTESETIVGGRIDRTLLSDIIRR